MVRALGGTKQGLGYAIATDANDNVFVAGYVNGAADLDGDGDTTRRQRDSGYGNNDAFLSVFTSSGTFLWAKRLGGTSRDFGGVVATDSVNNVIVVGQVVDAADLDGDGNTTGTNETSGYGNTDIFVSVFSPLGGFLWAKRLGGANSDSGEALAIDTADNIIVAGIVRGAADLDGDGNTTDTYETAMYGNTNDIFLSVFDSSGNFQWAKRLGGSVDDRGYAVATDTSNNVIVSGVAYAPADLDGDGNMTGTNETSGYGNSDAFLSVFDSSGTFQWSERLGGSEYDGGRALATDTNDNIVVGGYVVDAADLDGDGDTTGANETSGYGNQDAFVSAFDSSGSFLWYKRLGGASGDYGYAWSQTPRTTSWWEAVSETPQTLTATATRLTPMKTGMYGDNRDVFISKFTALAPSIGTVTEGGRCADITYTAGRCRTAPSTSGG